MQRAIQTVSVERGYDPRDFVLVPFGGAGPLHACALASEMRIPRILIPAAPGVLSALGMLLADFSRDYARSVMLHEDMLNISTLDTIFGLLETQALADMKSEGFTAAQVRFERWMDMRYKGQSFEIAITNPHDEDWITAFHVSHEQRYGYRQPGGVVESVNARLRAIGPRPKPVLPQLAYGTASSAHAVTGSTKTWFDDVFIDIPLVDRQLLLANNVVNGPAVIFQMDSTTLIEPGWQAIVDQWGNLILTK
jgi:N-methylhydantoinase A